ncbi:hypothetical protein BKA81DRAFT_350400 [Phyllosticta paracitricarpa]
MSSPSCRGARRVGGLNVWSQMAMVMVMAVIADYVYMRVCRRGTGDDEGWGEGCERGKWKGDGDAIVDGEVGVEGL